MCSLPMPPLPFDWRIIVFSADLLDIGQPVAPVDLHGILARPEQLPRLALVGPVLRLETVRLAEVVDGVVDALRPVQVLAKLKVSRCLSFLDRPGTAAAQHLLRRECEAARRSAIYPIPEGSDIRFGINPELANGADLGDLALRRTRRNLLVLVVRLGGIGGFGWPDTDLVLQPSAIDE